MNTVIWVISALLAAAFFAAGLQKILQPKEKLRERTPYVDDFSQNTVRGIGVAEVLGAVGLILPWALDIAPVLTPLAASGLVVVMVGAVLTHVRRKEQREIVPPLVLGALALLVAVVRFSQL